MDVTATTADINGATYQIGRLNPRKSFHVARRLAPFLGAIMPHLRALFLPDEDGKPPTVDEFALRGAALVPGIAQVIAEMSNDDCDYILDACLAVVQVKQDRNWAPIMAPSGQMMFDNIDMKTMLEITAEVIKVNLGEFFSFEPASGTDRASTSGEYAAVKFLKTGSGEDWLLRPVLAGLLGYETLLGTEVTLYDIAVLNDAMDVKAENEKRLEDHLRRQAESEGRRRRR